MTRHFNSSSKKALVVCLLLFCNSATIVSGAKKDPNSLQSQLESALLNKEFLNKIVLGNSYRQYNPEISQQVFTHLVDTEIYPNGGVRYYARRLGLGSGADPSYVSLEQLTSTVPIGTRVKVIKIELKDDRVEFLLSAGSSGLYAKYKLMFGKGYASQLTVDDVMKTVFSVLRDERQERLQSLEAEFSDLKAKLTSTETDFKLLNASAQSRMAAAEQTRQILKDLVQNRRQYGALRGASTEEQTAEFTKKITEFDSAISNLREGARKERIAEINNTLKVEKNEMTEILSQSKRLKPTTKIEWEREMKQLSRCDEILDYRQVLQQELQTLGASAPAADISGLQAEKQEISGIRKRLESAKQQLDLAQLNNEYREMERKRLTLLDAYTRSFGTSQQRLERDRLLAHLQRMVENRRAAQENGYDQAASQAEKLTKEMGRIQRQ